MRPALKSAIGWSGHARHDVVFANSSDLVYPVGKHIVVANIDTKEMSFVKKRRLVTAIRLSPCRKLVAVAQEASTPNEAGIAVHDLASKRILKTFSVANHPGEIVGLDFSQDARFIVSVADGNCDIVVWNVEKEKTVARTKAPSQPSRVRFHPREHTLVTVSGSGLLRLCKIDDDIHHSSVTMQALLNTQQEKKEKIVDHIWFANHQGVFLLTLSETCMVSVYHCTSHKSRSLIINLRQTISCSEGNEELQGLCLNLLKSAFVVGASSGRLIIFDGSNFDQQTPFNISEGFKTESEKEDIVSVAVCPGREIVICGTTSQKLLELNFGTNGGFADFPFLQHDGPISGLDICPGCRPFLVTVGSDRIIRMINYAKMEVVLLHKLRPSFGEPVSVALHPNGMALAVAFKDHVRVFDILMNELREKGAIFVQNCTAIKFACGGHLLACSTNLSINLYSFYTAKLVQSFADHIGRITSFDFSQSDGSIVSVGSDGAIVMRRVGSCWSLNKNLSTTFETAKLSCFSVDRHEKCVVVAGSGGFLCEIFNGQRKEFFNDTGGSSHPDEVVCMLLHPLETCLIAGTSEGNVRIYRWPLSEHGGKFQEVAVHQTSVRAMRLSEDGRSLFTASMDGTIFFHDLEGEEAFIAATGEDEPLWSTQADTVLISEQDLESHLKTKSDLEKDLQEERRMREHALSIKESEWMETLKEAKAEASDALSRERNKYKELRKQFENAMQQHLEDKQRLEANKMRLLQSMESEYEGRLAEAFRQKDEKEEMIEAIRQKADGVLVQQETTHLKEMNELQKEISFTVKDLKHKLAQAERDLANERQSHEEIITQQEREYELELVHIKTAMQNAIEKERSFHTQKQAELVETRNCLDRLQAKMSTLQQEKSKDSAKIEQLEKVENSLRDTIERYKQNMQLREEDSLAKEKTILRLRSNQKTLENFRYVLDHRIEKLMEDEGPVKEHVAKLEAHISEMYDEMVAAFEKKKQLDRQLMSKQLRVDALTNETQQVRHALKDREREVNDLMYTITTCAKASDPKVVSKMIADSYRTQVLKDNTSLRKAKTSKQPHTKSLSSLPEFEIASGRAAIETKRQRDQLHKTVKTLERALRASERKLGQKSRKSLQENAMLICECNRLRQEVFNARLRAQELERPLQAKKSSNQENDQEDSRLEVSLSLQERAVTTPMKKRHSLPPTGTIQRPGSAR